MPLTAQSQDVCPDLATDRSVLFGAVQDPELPGLPIAGAQVEVWWETEDEREVVETEVRVDGVYVVCGVPRDVIVFAKAMFGDREGTEEAIRVADEMAQLDLPISLSSDEDEDREKAFPIVMDGSGRCPELLAPSVARCVDFTDCSVVLLGSITVRRVGVGTDTRSTIEDFFEQARRRGGHAVDDLRASWRDDGARPILTRLEGNLVQFSDARCKRLAGVSG
ncbi:MAG: hypothetical protein MJB57_05055 [Gemmatimonadetes bacterium]|nr:hypothetical protein [Gemmatimonadota bacterium]